MKRARILAGALAASLACAGANAIDFTFSQSGFAGGSVTGSFSGEDVDGDGFLSFDLFAPGADTVSAFSLLFSGGGGLGAFSLGLADLEGLIFKIDGDDILGNDFNPDGLPEGLAAFDGATGNYFYAGDAFTLSAGVQGEVGNFYSYDFLESTSEATAVETVPDSGSSAALLGGAMLGLFAVGRRFSRNK